MNRTKTDEFAKFENAQINIFILKSVCGCVRRITQPLKTRIWKRIFQKIEKSWTGFKSVISNLNKPDRRHVYR